MLKSNEMNLKRRMAPVRTMFFSNRMDHAVRKEHDMYRRQSGWTYVHVDSRHLRLKPVSSHFLQL